MELSGNSSRCPRAAETECSVCNTLHYHLYPWSHFCEALINTATQGSTPSWSEVVYIHVELLEAGGHPGASQRKFLIISCGPNYPLFLSSVWQCFFLIPLFPHGCFEGCFHLLAGQLCIHLIVLSLYLALLLPSTWLSSVRRKARPRSAGQGASEARCWKMVRFVGLWHLTAPSVHLAAEPACPLTTEGRTAMPANY